MKLQTRRLTLEPLLAGHARSLFHDLRDPILYRYIPQDPPKTIRELAKTYRIWALGAPSYRKETWLNWALRLRPDGVYIGTLQATVHLETRSADIAYTLIRRFWKRGYAREACSRMIEHLSDSYRIRLIRATMDTRNGASARLARSLGMRKKWFLPDADFFKGSRSNEYQFERKIDARIAVPSRRKLI